MTKEYIYETPWMEIICLCGNGVVTTSGEDGVTMPGGDGWTDVD